jgi:glycosyltransferase involved in cell wall biosynthesis
MTQSSDRHPPAGLPRIPVGIWVEWHPGGQWINQGMTRLVGFLAEGNALSREYIFRIVVSNGIRDEAEEDLRAFAAERDIDYSIHSPIDLGIDDKNDLSVLVDFANEHVDVEGWISLFPHYDHAHRLKAPVTAIFPDAIPLVYPDFNYDSWTENGYHVVLRSKIQRQLNAFKRVITFSEHVANNHVKKIFAIDDENISVIPHAPPSLEGLLPFIGDDRTDESRSTAAELLRRHSAERGWDYLVDFPFEEIRYVAVSTQDRVTKNIRIAADAVERLVRRDRVDFKLLMTASLHIGLGWVPLPGAIERAQLQRDVISMTDLPRDIHAAFYHCAELAVHPSIFEGGLGVFPFYEAVSVGTPCIMAAGPHMAEFLKVVPEAEEFVFDPSDADALASMILRVGRNRSSALDIQRAAVKRLRKTTWGQIAVAYGRAAARSPQDLLRHGQTV